MDRAAPVSACGAASPSLGTAGKADLLPQPSHSMAAHRAAERRNDHMSLWKRGKVYWSYVYVDGIRYAQSTATRNLRQATHIEQRFKEALNLKRHQIIEPRPEMLLGELAARFLAEGAPRPWHIDRLKLLLPYWSEVPIGRIHKSMTDDYGPLGWGEMVPERS